MASLDSLAESLFGNRRAETNSVLIDGTTHTYVGTATSDSADGSVMVELSSDVTNPDPITFAEGTEPSDNICEFLSHDFSDIGTNASGAYWLNGGAVINFLSETTPLEDGWAHCALTGSSPNYAVRVNQSKIDITAGQTYTLMVEIRNVVSAPVGPVLMLNSDTTMQFYGDMATHPIVEGAVYYIPATGSSNVTQSGQLFIVGDNARLSGEFDIRLSLYEGAYSGEYQPPFERPAYVTYYGDASTSVELPTTETVQEGDEVLVTVYGGSVLRSPVVTGVVGSGDRMQEAVDAAAEAAESAEGMAQDAIDAANAVNQHFFTDKRGAHITEVTKDDWDANPTGPNTLLNSLGLLIRNGLNNLAAFLTSGIALYDGLGNQAANMIASFNKNVVQLAMNPQAVDGVITASLQMFSGLAQILSTYRPTDGALSVAQSANSTSDMAYKMQASTGSQVIDNSDGSAVAGQGLSAQIVEGSATNRASMGVQVYRNTSGGYVNEAYVDAPTWELIDSANSETAYITMAQATAGMREACATYYGANGTATATATGWRLTYFNVPTSTPEGDGIANYLTFSNGRITAKKNIRLVISGVMNWTDTLAGIRGFGVFIDNAVGTSTAERSVFSNFPSGTGSRKSVVYPPRLFRLDAGHYINIARYEQTNAVYTNGSSNASYSFITLSVIGVY